MGLRHDDVSPQHEGTALAATRLYFLLPVVPGSAAAVSWEMSAEHESLCWGEDDEQADEVYLGVCIIRDPVAGQQVA